MRSRDAEVIVVGGGPAGAATATRLARRGARVTLLDKTAFPREKPCGEYLSPGVIDALERLGALDAVLAREHARPAGMDLRSPRARFLLSYGTGHESRRALGIQRPLLDAALLDHARAAGVEVVERARVNGLCHDGERVAGVRVSQGGSVTELRAGFVVAADGLHSTVARLLGLDRPVRWPKRLGLVARYRVPGPRLDAAEMHVGDGVYCGLNPVGEDVINVGLVGPLGAKRSGETTAQLFTRQLARLPGAERLPRAGERISPIRGMGPLARRVRRVAAPGVLLVGDAAGFLDPFTGEGIYRALTGAELAAEAVERALTRDDRLPIGYAAERRRRLGDKERVCLIVQLLLTSGYGFDYAMARLGRRHREAATLCGVLGDYLPARLALRPPYLWRLLRP